MTGRQSLPQTPPVFVEAFQVAMEQKQRYKSRCSDQPQSSARPFPFTAEVRNFDGHITVVARAMGKKRRKARVEVPNGEILSFTGYADGRFFCNIEGYPDAALSVAAHHMLLSTAQHEALSRLGIVLATRDAQPQSTASPFPFTAQVRNFDGHSTVVARAMGKKKAEGQSGCS